MKKLQALVLACGICMAGNAQITAINPTAEGGFETGTTFASTGWTLINPTTVANQWVLTNNAPAFGGSRGAHVSNDGSSYSYTTGSSRTCHFFRDVTIPAGADPINLSFYWKGGGQSGRDRMLVYIAPTTVVPVANAPASPSTAITDATLIWTQPTYTGGGYSIATFPLSAALAGTTFRLIFTWQNDASAGITPGAAVDNISLTYSCSTPAANIGNSPTCIGAGISLSNPFVGGTWSNANPGVASISPTGNVIGVGAGTAAITYTSGSCQSVSIVTVFPAPLPITGRDTVCLGETTTFANSVIGGTWSSSFPAVASILSGSGIITGIAAGGSYITYTMPGGCSITDTVHVVDFPAAISGSMQVCPNATTILTNSSAGGRWLSLNPGSASVNANSGVVTGINAGTANMAYTSRQGCTVYATVTINPLPNQIIGKSILCSLNLDTLYNSSPGGTWSSLTPSIASVSSMGVMSALSGGTAVIRYTLPTSCSITKSITVHPAPNPTVYFNGPTNTLSTDTGYVTYQWYHTIFGKVTGATYYRTAGLYNGGYYVVATDTNGCSGSSAIYTYNTAMGVGSIAQSSDVTIFPNPATDVLNLVSYGTVDAIVASMDGKILMNEKGVSSISVGELPTGIYMITIYNSKGLKIAIKQFVKQ